MNEHETTDTTAVLDTLRGSLDGITMSTPAEQIEAAGRRRRNHRRLIGIAGIAAAAALALAASQLVTPSTAPPTAADSTGPGAVHPHTAAYTIDKKTDGTLQIITKDVHFTTHTGQLEKALREAGIPVLVKKGEFCKGPDDSKLEPIRLGLKLHTDEDGRITYIFTLPAIPPGKQLFIPILDGNQPAPVHLPGPLDWLVPADGPLTCTTTLPPEYPLS